MHASPATDCAAVMIREHCVFVWQADGSDEWGFLHTLPVLFLQFDQNWHTHTHRHTMLWRDTGECSLNDAACGRLGDSAAQWSCTHPTVRASVFVWESAGTQLLGDAQLCAQAALLSGFVCFRMRTGGLQECVCVCAVNNYQCHVALD